MLTLPVYVEQLRREVRLLRIRTAQLSRMVESRDEEKKRLEEENRRLKRENEQLQRENEKLKKEIEKLTKTARRYQVALFDHGNFKHPDEGEKKLKGGQIGHADTNREAHEDYRYWTRKRLFAKTCNTCQRSLPRVNATRERILLDIIVNPQVLKLIVASERQWCNTCRKEITAKHPQSLPFTEYGITTFMMVLMLRYRCLLSFSKIATVMRIAFGLLVAKSDITNLLVQSKRYLGYRYDKLIEHVRKGDIMYNDETGWLVHGQKAWMWIMANEKTTVYVAAESRGRGIMEDMYQGSTAYSMHDGLASYTNSIPKEKQCYCWSHILRFSFEETEDLPSSHPALSIREALVAIYRLQRDPRYQKRHTHLEQEARRRINRLLAVSSEDSTVAAILGRLGEQKEGLIRALLVTPDGTNNLAERELRPIAIVKHISYGSDTFGGMETTAVLASITQTLARSKQKPFLPTLKQYLQEGVKRKHPHYAHVAYFDSS